MKTLLYWNWLINVSLSWGWNSSAIKSLQSIDLFYGRIKYYLKIFSFRFTARVILYAPSHRPDCTYHGLYFTSRGALAGTRNSSMGSPHEGLIRRPIAPWANALTTELGWYGIHPQRLIKTSYLNIKVCYLKGMKCLFIINIAIIKVL